MKRLAGFIIGIALLIQTTVPAVYAGEVPGSDLYLEYDGGIHKYASRIVDIDVDGETIPTGDMPAIILQMDGKGRTLVPVREVFESEAFGASVKWFGESQTVFISYGDTIIQLQIDSKIAYVNNQKVELDVPAKLIRDTSKAYAKTMIPLRFVSEQLGIFDVDWDQTSYTALLTSKSMSFPDEPEETTETETSASDEEKLDSLVADKATKELPTALADLPVLWAANQDDVDALNRYAAILEEAQSADGSESAATGTAYANSITYTETDLYRAFVIKASATIPSYKENNWNQNLIIDLEGVISRLDGNYAFDGNPVVNSVRTSQYQYNPDITRVVFDMKDTSFTHIISAGEDGKTLTIAFAKDVKNLENILDNVVNNVIKEVNLRQNDIGDYIEAIGATAPEVKAFRLTNPNRLVFDLLNTKSALYSKTAEGVEGQYVTTLRTGQFDDNTTRIVVETDGQADYDVLQSGSRTIIQLHEPDYSNIVYENLDHPTFTLEKASEEAGIVLDSITYINDYINRKYRIILPEDYTDRFGAGDIKVNDGLIDSVNIATNKNGKTELTILSTVLREYRIEEIDGEIKIVAYKPSDLYDQVVVLDFGHGGKDPGASANGLVEKVLNLDIGLRLKALMDAEESVKVYYTRTDDSYPTLQERCDLANEAGADFFISIHNNAYLAAYSGTDVLHYSDTRNSGLDNYELAEIFMDEITTTTGMPERRLVVRPDLYVLHHTEMPAIIAEIGFMTNPDDAAKLADPEFRQAVAVSLYQGILRTFNEYPTGR